MTKKLYGYKITMVFSTLIFTFIFLPACVCLYFLAKEKYRNYILLSFSLAFYAYGEPKVILVMIFSIMANYVMALLIDKSGGKKIGRLLLALDVLGNIGILYVFKYVGFTNILLTRLFGREFNFHVFHLPIGISFFTFQALSYVIDVYRRKVGVQKNPANLALYISFFPQLVAGPIVRYETVEQQITQRTCSIEKFGEGAKRFFAGFAKKIILANNIAVVTEKVFSVAEIETANPAWLWLGSLCFSLQIFYDFSGYSDMAIGLGKMFGFEFEENFDYPYISKSVTEFWRRWHISLGRWFRDYVYIPLGGSKVRVPRNVLNLFVVWTLTGIWHGAGTNFVAWGLGYFILLVIEKFFIKPQKRNVVIKIFWQGVTLLCVNFGWVIFNIVSLRRGIKFCLAMLGFYDSRWSVDTNIIRYAREYGVFILAGIIFSMPVGKFIYGKIFEHSEKLRNVLAVVLPLGYATVFLWAVSYILLGAHNPFIYFNF